MSTGCPAWCVDHDGPDPLGLPVLHFSVPTPDAKDGPYLFQQADDAPLVGLFGERLGIDEAERIAVQLAACVAAANGSAAP